MLEILQLIHIGTLVLLYHLDCTHYPRRGGYSEHLLYCGVFYIAFNASYSYIGWSGGAALSFRLSTHYTLRGGASNSSAVCGVFSVADGNIFSSALWYCGAAL